MDRDVALSALSITIDQAKTNTIIFAAILAILDGKPEALNAAKMLICSQLPGALELANYSLERLDARPTAEAEHAQLTAEIEVKRRQHAASPRLTAKIDEIYGTAHEELDEAMRSSGELVSGIKATAEGIVEMISKGLADELKLGRVLAGSDQSPAG